MHRTTTFLIATALATLMAAPVWAKPLKYVGISAARFDGNAGIITFHAACDATFPGSQMCTSEDIILGGTDPGVETTDQVFVHPVIVVYDEDLNMAVDFSGQTATPENLSCRGWSTKDGTTKTGLAIVANTGLFTIPGCGFPSPKPVATTS